MKIESYKNLIVWQKSVTLVEEIYKMTSQLPNSEKYSLYDQMNRSVISIPSNIAEGNKRAGIGDYIRFLMIASGSAAELDTQIYILKKRYLQINTATAETLLLEVQKMSSVLTFLCYASPERINFCCLAYTIMIFPKKSIPNLNLMLP